ncbi:hypothetical protein [Bradyrhizobium cytisi]|uniref:Uncharacterized protein n=1 Tax=Bradyrhizobium cytisi TaxID=515489 RepID=A0A5S4WRZ5_9BRAD|nr:hypothetical protein [Bradyrhizobium cytisi]TYL84326.1 hypothetical protein FXB38_15910 [Bradyrhizobium cytisi]
MVVHAILSTNGAPPVVGERLLVAIPTSTTNPHSIGRIVTVAPRAGGHMPTYDLTVEIENADDAAAKAAFQRSIGLDSYADHADAERWHAVDVEHFGRRGFARNHWHDYDS